ncbi:hypothetical protein PUNSTDRAFT_139116 [Punctularia strigosozonata HHB-11173 SS5]|uniref:RA-domain-containing protein n=1 Tax=Punctularia strigosozonata (strain HHB-11173) TaxID=741275 RepID=R7S3L5_PUNST|nr:uncharacterized protein PUNSTDRAFT_139116 [Punctularia strigosozonata HHB-11173 SS5]EIN03811.1 hypothetical protein PUNSTDRAFT_139116 [Punctularia strigosozonata HHB-11173 SS5]
MDAHDPAAAAADSAIAAGSLLDWDEGAVAAFFSTTLHLPQYAPHVREQRISGEVLALLDPDSLRELGVATIGQRLQILKAVYNLKVAQGIPIEPDHYVPPSEVQEQQDRQQNLTPVKLHDMLKEQDDRLKALEEENKRLIETLHSCLEDIAALRTRAGGEDSPIPKEGASTSFRWANFIKPSKSPTKAAHVIDSPQGSPLRAEHDISASMSASAPAPVSRSTAGLSGATLLNEPSSLSTSLSGPSSLQTHPPKPQPTRQESSDNLKSFKVSLEDPAWKVLPAALKKYKINNDDWQNYAMFICYGADGNRIERCLSYDEKPLLLFQKLKDAKKNPVFMLKHIKDIRSPIAVAEQKQRARKASSIAHTPHSAPKTAQLSASTPTTGGAGRTGVRPPRIDVHGSAANVAPGPVTGTAPQGPGAGGWLEAMSPAVENAPKRLGDGSDSAPAATPPTGTTGAGTPGPGSVPHSGPSPNSGPSGGGGSARELPPPSASGISYAVAIYPYMAEQDDEFDVVVGDTFVVLSRARGWWVVQRDPAGAGVVEPDTALQGWVPAGCLLETRVPVASAIAEARAGMNLPAEGEDGEVAEEGEGEGRREERKTPILPLAIVSTSFPGVALTDYTAKGEEELDLVKDDSLRVFKRYNHWSYAVKEENGERGWVPSWYIGKVSSNVPQTPVPGSLANVSATSVTLDGDSSTMAPQPSPMSSAFPATQKSTTVV